MQRNQMELDSYREVIVAANCADTFSVICVSLRNKWQ